MARNTRVLMLCSACSTGAWTALHSSHGSERARPSAVLGLYCCGLDRSPIPNEQQDIWRQVPGMRSPCCNLRRLPLEPVTLIEQGACTREDVVCFGVKVLGLQDRFAP